jgi:hypothetical protein
LTFLQAWRIAGLAFLALYSYGLLPGLFALPAGLGDIAIGATAPLVAMRLANPDHRKSFILWQLLGIADLVTAVTMDTTARLIEPHGIATSPMTVLPLSLIATFAVPLMFVLHILCIAQARHGHEQKISSVGTTGLENARPACPAPGIEHGLNFLLAGVDGLSLFDERLHPAEDARPSLGVIDSRLWGSRKSLLTNPH